MKVANAIFTTATLLAIESSLLFAPATEAAEGGYSNYIPGTYGDFAMAVAPANKLTLRNDFYYYNADASRTVRSGRVEASTDLTILSNFTTLLYKPDVKLLEAQYAFGVFFPIGHLDLESEISGKNTTLSAEDDVTGVGDIAWIPLALYWSWDKFHLSFMHFIVSPTGEYDKNDPLNVSLNYWSFDTNVALTYLNPDSGQDYSLNVGYIYNTENDDTDYHTGQEIHLDVAFNQFLSETFAVGIHGFYLNQITGDSGSGALLGDFQAEALGVGPAVFWGTKIWGQDVSFIAKWLHEVHADNRMEGDHIMASFAMDW